MKVLLIDNYDSFIHILSDYFAQLGVDCVVIRNDEAKLLKLTPKDFDAMVIGPGPATPDKSGFLMTILPNWISNLPVLGVCLGHQAIGEYFGAKLLRAKKPMHGKVDQMTHSGGEIFEGVPNGFFATRYHSLILKDLPPVLKGDCWCNDELMALSHVSLPVFGLQFHPESCETQFGLRIVKNFLDLAKKYTQI